MVDFTLNIALEHCFLIFKNACGKEDDTINNEISQEFLVWIWLIEFKNYKENKSKFSALSLLKQ